MEHLLTPEIVNGAINLAILIVSTVFGWASLKAGQFFGPAGRQAAEIATNAALDRLQAGIRKEAAKRGWVPGKTISGSDALSMAEAVADRNPDAMATVKATAQQLAATVPGLLASAAAK